MELIIIGASIIFVVTLVYVLSTGKTIDNDLDIEKNKYNRMKGNLK